MPRALERPSDTNAQTGQCPDNPPLMRSAGGPIALLA